MQLHRVHPVLRNHRDEFFDTQQLLKAHKKIPETHIEVQKQFSFENAD